jgi:MATE family multidrug resistance protein
MVSFATIRIIKGNCMEGMETAEPASGPARLENGASDVSDSLQGEAPGLSNGCEDDSGEAAQSSATSPQLKQSGHSRELLAIAAPLILSQSFMTVQVFVDTLLLSWHDPLEMTASFPAVMWFWLAFGFLQVTAGYTSTFVAQYTGAGRPHRVGAAVWQGIYFGALAGMLFLVMVPAAPFLISLGGHTPALQALEVTYLRCLAFAGMPMLVMAAVNGFFSGRGQTWTVLGIEAFGTGVNVILALGLVFGRAGLPELGIEGAGWATVAGSWSSALLAIVLFLQPRYRAEFATAGGWRVERELFGRLMRFGGPAGLQVFLDVLVFHLFTQLVGRLGEAEMGATTLTIRLNMVAFLPMMGLGQAICILVGQRLGADRPDLAERITYTGLRWMFGYMTAVALMYVAIPGVLVSIFEGGRAPEEFAKLAALVPALLLCVAVFSLADALNLSFAFALRGAGDTWFVSWLTFCLAWPIMVAPTFIVVQVGASLYWAWAFATAHIFAMAVCFFFRFRSGKWKSMRVIETAAPAI